MMPVVSGWGISKAPFGSVRDSYLGQTGRQKHHLRGGGETSMHTFFGRARGTVCAVGLLVMLATGLAPTGCNSSVDTLTNSGQLSDDGDRDTLPLTVNDDADYSHYRVNATPLNAERSQWEFEVTSDSGQVEDLSFVWSFNNQTELSGIKQRFSFLQAGVQHIRLSAFNSDEELLFIRRLDIEVPELEVVPVADAGVDQTVDENELTFLYGEESYDPNDDDLSYQWVQTAGPAVTLLDADQANASFVAPSLDEDAELEFTLTVSDGDHHSEDSVRVVVVDASEDESLNGAVFTPGSGAGSTPGGGAGTTPGSGTNPCLAFDTDSDGDGTNDCDDECPGDPLKTDAGTCGCGLEDIDADENGVLDCLESDASVFSTLIVYAGPDASIAHGGSVLLLATVSGGRPPYTYQWFPSGGLNNPTILRPTASPTTTATYTLTVTDSRSRVAFDSAVITVLPPLVANAGPDRNISPGGSATLNGSASGGTTPYSFQWSPTTGLSNANIAQPTASPSTTTTYTLTASDAQARTATDTVVVTVGSSLVANAGPDRTIQAGGSASLSGSASGGTAPYTYRWAPTTGLSNPNIAQPTAAPSVTTTYTLTVTDAQARTATDSATVTVLTSLTANAGPDRTIAAGASTTLTGSATGGVPPYTYQWSPTTGLNNANIAQPTASPSATTTYTLTVNDALTQVDTDTVQVTVTGSSAILSVNPTFLGFGGSTNSLSFGVWNSGSGTLNYTIQDNAAWLTTSPTSGSSTGEQDSISATVNRTGLANGSYQAEITVTPTTGSIVTILVTMSVGASPGSAMTTASRTSGVAPLAVFFDAVGAASGVIQPPVVNGRADYATFHYQWNFGDNPNALWATDSRSKNEAFGQVAAHVFESAGTFTVNLVVTQPSGATQTYQQQISVQDPEVVYANSSNSTAERTYYVAAEGSDTNNGSYNQPFRTWAHAKSRLFLSNGPRRVLLKRGQTFTHTSGGTVTNRTGPFTIGAYGVGAKPVIHHAGNTGEVVALDSTATDVRIMDVDFTATNVGYCLRPGINTLMLRSRSSNFGSVISTSDLYGNRARNFFVDCEMVNSDRYGIYYNFGQHVAVMGTTIDDVNGEHLLRCYITHSVIQHCVFRNGHPNKHQLKFCGYFPTGNAERAPGTPTEAVEHSIISDNRFENPGSINWMITIGPVDQAKDQRIENVIFERNFLRAGPQTTSMLYANNRYVTVRNNVFDGTGAPGVSAIRITRRGVEPAPVGYTVFNNTMYRSGSGGFTAVQIDSMVQNTEVKNNLINAPGATVIGGGGTGLVASNNLMTSTPGFANPVSGNFSLLAGSPAIDAGTNVPSVFVDYMTAQRPYDGNNAGGPQWDNGAYEYRPIGGNPVNLPPVVDAGPAQQITLPVSNVNLDGTVTDDGRPNPPATVTSTWSLVSGPGAVTFGNVNAVDTTAVFPAAGSYTLRLTASDSALTASDEVTITVNPATAGGTERMGINTSKVYGWGTQIPFVDAFKQSRVWLSANADGTNSNTGVVIPLDAQGYPLQIPYDNGGDPPQIIRTRMLDVESGTYPAGTYTLIFDGDGTVTLGGNASGTFNQTGGTGSYPFTVSSPSGSGIDLRITRSAASNRVRNIHVIMPGHLATYTTQPFYPPFRDHLAGFGVIRFMEWIRTNGNDYLVSWSDRVTPDYVTQAGPKGAAFEYAIQLCNAVGADCWLTIPHRADDGFVTELARLVKNNLSAQRKVYVEYSNELWNGMFDQTTYVRDQGLALGLGPDSVLAGRRYTAKRSAEIFRIFVTEFGAEQNRLVKVLAGQAASTNVASQLLDAFQQPSINGVPINPTGVSVDALAIAPYFGNGLADSIVTSGEVNTITVAEILNRAETTYLPTAITRMQTHKVIADQYGIPLIAYEGGQHIVATGANVNNTTLTQKLNAANRDPRMYDIYRNYFTAWFNTGGESFAHYSFCQTPSQYGSWGALEHLGQSNSEAHKYRALVDVIALPD